MVVNELDTTDRSIANLLPKVSDQNSTLDNLDNTSSASHSVKNNNKNILIADNISSQNNSGRLGQETKSTAPEFSESLLEKREKAEKVILEDNLNLLDNPETFLPGYYSNSELSFSQTARTTSSNPACTMMNGARGNVTASSGANNPGYTVSVVDLSYSVKNYFNSKKNILRKVTTHFEPGLNGILGPSGCGKTTLLDIISCHKPIQRKYLTGQVLVNGNLISPTSFRAISAYVPQDDHLSEFLTVRENLMFSANIRMTGKTSVEKYLAVDRMIELLHLERCEHTMIGNYLIRGISTGEKKRTCIAMELLLEPSILMLDEPTTGLDSYSANEIVTCLTKVANESKKTIIMSLHQPRYSIYKQLNAITLFTVDGRLAYHGECASAKDYFVSRGFVCEVAENPCDFFIDLIQSYSHEAHKGEGEDEEEGAATRTEPPNLNSADNPNQDDPTDFKPTASPAAEPVDASSTPEDSLVIQSVRYYDSTSVVTIPNGLNQSSIHLFEKESDKNDSEKCKGSRHTLVKMFEVSSEMEVMKKKIEDSLGQETVHAQKKHQTFRKQMKYLFARDIKSLYRNPECVFGQVIIATFLSVLFGLLYYKSELSPDRGFQNRHGLFFFLSLSLMMMNLGHIELFVSQQKLFFHEYANGYFYLLPYFLSNVVFDLITLRVIPCLIFGFTLTFMVGLRSDFDALFYLLVMLIMLAISGCGISYLVTSLLRTFYISHISVIMIFVVMMVFAGLIINLKTLPEWVEGLKYFSLVYYGVSGLSVNEFVGLKFCGKTSINQACPGIGIALENTEDLDIPEGNVFCPIEKIVDELFTRTIDLCVSGEAGLDVQGIEYSSTGKWFYVGMVSIGAVIAYTLTFIRLYWSNRL